MPILQVVCASPRSGKTAVAVGLAHGFARSGQRVTLARAGSGANADADARAFADYLFASSTGQPVDATALRAAADSEVLLVELDAGATPLNHPAVVVVRGRPAAEDDALARSLGQRLVGTVALGVTTPSTEEVARALTNADMRPIALLPEDLALAAPSVGDLSAALDAEVLFEGEDWDETVENVIVAPIYTDPARPHFRRFEAKAILTPYYKTDLLIAAIESGSVCVVATGGKQPNGYVIDRALHSPTTLLVSPRDTLETVNALADAWSAGRFQGERKAEAVTRLMDGRIDFSALARKL